jgi:hypothetical protein
VVESTRTKGYTIDLLAAMVVLWLMLRWFLDGRKARYLAGLAFCAPVFVWLSYTSIFVSGAAGLIVMMCALGGIARDIALRIREFKGPGIRRTLLEASRLAGHNGQFVVLNDEDASWLFAYYIKRAIRQQSGGTGELQARPGQTRS